MPRIAEPVVPVTGGVDTHADVHVAAAVDQVGRVLGTLLGSNIRSSRWRAALEAAWTCHAAVWYSWVSPPRTCFRRIRCSARLISGGWVGAWAGVSWPKARCGRAVL
jgi:hypothetical protein